jgi:hypothetical protein
MDEVGHRIQQGLLRVRCALSPLFTLTYSRMGLL